jgi:hypothetical protein
MPTLQEPARAIPVADEVDVCVAGGSCTGVFAAVRAARLGARVALVESQGFFGGTATASLVNIWHPLLDAEFRQPIAAGLTLEVLRRLKARAAVIETAPSAHAGYLLNPEELKIELDELVREAGARPFLHAHAVATLPGARPGELDALLIEDKSGRRAIRARAFIDATGDGDLLARAGLAFEVRPHPQPPTTVAVFDHFGALEAASPKWADEVFAPERPQALAPGFLWTAPLPGRPDARLVAGTRVNGANCIDADSLTAAEMEGRRQVRAMVDILRSLPGGAQLTLSNLPSRIGLRESRHAVARHRLTVDQILQGASFPDAIACGTYPVDIHHNDRPGVTLRYLDGTERYIAPRCAPVLSRWRAADQGVTPFYQIPFRSLVPRDARNLLVAGRLVDADRDAYGAIRVMVNANQTGEAAGVACALAVRSGIDPVDLDPELLRRALCDGGSLLPGLGGRG